MQTHKSQKCAKAVQEPLYTFASRQQPLDSIHSADVQEMGGAVSSPAKVQHKLRRSEEEVVRLMMPVFYNGEPITPEERKVAAESWNLILDDKSPVFVDRKGKPDFPYQTCVTYFYDTFYSRLFDIHPTCRHMFKNGLRSQGKFLVKMISLSLSELDDPQQYDRNLIKLAENHYDRGVKSVECKCVDAILCPFAHSRCSLQMPWSEKCSFTFYDNVWVRTYTCKMCIKYGSRCIREC